MRCNRRRPRAFERPAEHPSANRSPADLSSLHASRLLSAAAATLAASVMTDSTAEHYRAGFHNRAMFVAPAMSAAALTAAMIAVTSRDHGVLSRAVFAASAVTGLVGFGFHLTNVSRRVGGWNSTNVFHGAPIAAPLAITMSGVLGFAASRLAESGMSRNDGSSARASRRAAVALGTLSALGLTGTSMEAGVLHFRGAFQNPFMYAPVVIPPIAAVTLATAVLTRSGRVHHAAGSLLRLTGGLGIVGSAFHAWGVHRRMAGWRNWRQNVLAGPPLPAPPAFTALALAGLAALKLLKIERTG